MEVVRMIPEYDEDPVALTLAEELLNGKYGPSKLELVGTGG
jgi:hypothetical protein